MDYDNGGILPSGLDDVVNLAGPEPVLTAAQWAELGNRYIQDNYGDPTTPDA